MAGGTVYPSPSCRLPQQNLTPPSSPFRGRRAKREREEEEEQWGEYEKQMGRIPLAMRWRLILVLLILTWIALLYPLLTAMIPNTL